IPVLAVYEKTSSSSGFSIKSVTRPSSSTVTMPNPDGSSTFLSTRVASAPRSSWKERASVRSTFVRASPQPILDVLDRAGRAQGLLLDGVLDVHPPLGSIAEVALYNLWHVLQGDYHALEAVASKEFQDVLHTRLVDYRDHGLRLVARQWPQPCPFPPGHDHGFHKPSLCDVMLIVRSMTLSSTL